ncbi:MAG: sensor domain-containing diguanylate cyclase [Fimbriimonadaceae bacterium]|nr:sensor domain-containing diguanylate cyclase [Fimbriimonadaceae bacterium]
MSLADELSVEIKDAGFEVQHTEHAAAVADLCLRDDIRIVAANRFFPEMSGLELSRQLSELPGPIRRHLVLYGGTTPQISEAILQAEAFGAAPRPSLEKKDFIAKLRSVARIAQMEQAAYENQRKVQRIQANLELANKSLTIASRRFEELFSGLPVASFTFDNEGKIREWNRQAEVLFEVAAFEAMERTIWDVMGESSSELWNGATVEAVLAGQEIAHREWTYVNAKGEENFLVCSVIPLTGGTGSVVGAISANIDITDRVLAERQVEWHMQEIREQKSKLEEANRKLERLAETDGLTGLINHRKMYELLDGMLAEGETKLSAILMDVDSFKSFNDNYGHLAGDQVLRNVAKLADEAIGNRGSVARYGGEEFAVLLKGFSPDEAIRAAEDVRNAIADFVWESRQITVSVGVATLQPDENGAALLRRCDTALYMAKGTGKNRVVHFDTMTEADLSEWSKAA